MATWETLQGWHLTHIDIKLPRVDTVEKEYSVWMQDTANKETLLRLVSDSVKETGWMIRLNDFPYHLDPGCNHYVFWFKGQISMSEAWKIAQRELGLLPEQIIVTCNIRQNKTVPECEHYHLFYRL